MNKLTSNLTLHQYAAIGKVACEWAHVEQTLRWFVKELAKVDIDTAMRLTAELSAKNSMDIILALSATDGVTLEGQPLLHRVLHSAQSKIAELRGERNRIVHRDWLKGKSGQPVAINVRADSGRFRTKLLEPNALEHERVAAEISNLNDWLWQTLLDHKADRLQEPLREPRERSPKDSHSSQTKKKQGRKQRRSPSGR
jgi:hypothetical protein